MDEENEILYGVLKTLERASFPSDFSVVAFFILTPET